jgi:hypothetical protein
MRPLGQRIAHCAGMWQAEREGNGRARHHLPSRSAGRMGSNSHTSPVEVKSIGVAWRMQEIFSGKLLAWQSGEWRVD